MKKETPPTFLVHAMDDAGIPMENSLLFFQAMKDKGVPGELHVYPSGGHGLDWLLVAAPWKTGLLCVLNG